MYGDGRFRAAAKEAMARKDPPAWFEARVLAAVERQPERRGASGVRWAVAAFASLMLVSGIAWQQSAECRNASRENGQRPNSSSR